MSAYRRVLEADFRVQTPVQQCVDAAHVDGEVARGAAEILPAEDRQRGDCQQEHGGRYAGRRRHARPDPIGESQCLCGDGLGLGGLLRGGGLGRLRGLLYGLPLLRRLQAELLVEPLDAALGVEQLLLAGEKRMAGSADLEVQLVLGRARLERVATRATRLDELRTWGESLPSRQTPDRPVAELPWGTKQKV